MYVCVCHGVTENSIREAVSAGLRNLKQLREHLGVAGSCGRCAQCARTVVQDTVGECAGGCGQACERAHTHADEFALSPA